MAVGGGDYPLAQKSIRDEGGGGTLCEGRATRCASIDVTSDEMNEAERTVCSAGWRKLMQLR